MYFASLPDYNRMLYQFTVQTYGEQYKFIYLYTQTQTQGNLILMSITFNIK